MMGQIPSREEYTRQRMDEIAALAQFAGGSGNTKSNTNSTTRYSDAGRYDPHNPPQGAHLTYLNDDCLFPGTIIHAILVSRIDTDYPGPIHARVIENVYDSMTGKNLLIPQGTILQGNYSSSSIGVSKVQIAWESMVVNYQGVAYQVSLGGMAGVDKRGRAGIAGTLDDHYFEWLKAAGIISLFTMLNSEISYQTRGQTNQQVRELMDINQGIVNQLGNKLIERALDIQPTVRVANGTAVSVSVNTVVNLRPFPAIKAEEKWIRK
jgi:type IV secretion system protein VirB10